MSISSQLSSCTSNKFNIIYADPPWKYNQSVKQGVLKRKDGSLIYPSMSMKELEALGPEMQRITKDDSALLLWATMPLLPEAFRLMEAWGFKYKTCFVNWVKTTKQGDRPAFGVGYYTRLMLNSVCWEFVVKLHLISVFYPKNKREVLHQCPLLCMKKILMSVLIFYNIWRILQPQLL